MDSVLSIRDVSIQIRNQQLLQNISFDIGEGEVVLLSGANGIGKSSLLKSILRLDNEGKTINGEIIVRGFGDILKLNSAEIQNSDLELHMSSNEMNTQKWAIFRLRISLVKAASRVQEKC